MRITVTPDREHAESIRQAIYENEGYCPCSTIKNEDTKCMCKEFREAKSGTCHCGLYIKEESSK